MFGKLQRTADVNQEGIGLGLTICKELCSKNGGEIAVESAGEGKGSTFAFSMKMSVVPDDSQNGERDANLQTEEFKSDNDDYSESTQVFECQEIQLSQINLEQPADNPESETITNPWVNKCPVF